MKNYIVITKFEVDCTSYYYTDDIKKIKLLLDEVNYLECTFYIETKWLSDELIKKFRMTKI